MSDKDKKVSKSRLWVFKGIAMLLPILLLVLTEILLRSIHYAEPEPLFIPEQAHSGYLKMNQFVSLRYFQNQQLATWGQYDLFAQTKTERTIRIVVQGASTGVGFPFMQSIAYPKIIERNLQRAYPAYQFEVINTSLAATNSFTMLDFAHEIIEIDPDLILIYGGHNEYYGVLGAASSQRSVGSYGLNLMFIKLKNIRILQALKQLIYRIRSKPINEEATLMANMIGKQEVPLHSKIYDKGIEQYRRNMTKLLDTYRDADIPVVMTTLVCNERDQKPFLSMDCTGYPSLDEECNLSTCQEAAKTWYALALQMQDPTCQSWCFHQAKEYDLLRFRAPDAMNDYIRSLDGVSMLDLDSLFRELSNGGSVGSDYMTEHVHPNIEGYYQMADFLLQEIVQHLNFDPNRLSEAWIRHDYNPVDSIYGNMLLGRLKANWPFVEDLSLQDPLKNYTSNDPIEQYILYLYRGQLSWVEVVNKCYTAFMNSNDYLNALRVGYNLTQEFPLTEEPKSMTLQAGLKLKDFELLAKLIRSWGQEFLLSDPFRVMAFNIMVNGQDLETAIFIKDNETRQELADTMHKILYADHESNIDSLKRWHQMLGNDFYAPIDDFE